MNSSGWGKGNGENFGSKRGSERGKLIFFSQPFSLQTKQPVVFCRQVRINLFICGMLLQVFIPQMRTLHNRLYFLTKKKSKIKKGDIRCSYIGYNDMDEPTGAFSVSFDPTGSHIYAGYKVYFSSLPPSPSLHAQSSFSLHTSPK